jgi:hypothetical protein
MTTNIWFTHNGKRYFAKMACQNGSAKVLEAKTEEGQQVDPEYIQQFASKAHKRINNWGEIEKGDEQNEV